MSYLQTARAFSRASSTRETWSPDAAYLDGLTRGLSHGGNGYEPGMKAHAHAAHVSEMARALREAEADLPPYDMRSQEATYVDAARALLDAIGEGTEG